MNNYGQWTFSHSRTRRANAVGTNNKLWRHLNPYKEPEHCVDNVEEIVQTYEHNHKENTHWLIILEEHIMIDDPGFGLYKAVISHSCIM